MTFVIARRLLAAASCAAALTAAMAPSAAHADVTWNVTGTFDDNGTVSGFFNINVYGYLDGYDLKTTNGSPQGPVTAFDYTPADSYFSNGTFYVDAQPGYEADLHLEFTDDLSVPLAYNPIKGGEGGPSYECQGSFSCYVPEYGATRYIADGYASAGAVPEPAVWAGLVIGFGLTGGAMRRARRLGQGAAAAA
jgi:hypothetical protein